MNALGEMPIVNHEADLALRRLAIYDGPPSEHDRRDAAIGL
jgi:hypothetical protein